MNVFRVIAEPPVSVDSGPGKLNAKEMGYVESIELRRWTSKTAPGVFDVARSPGRSGDHALKPTTTGEVVSNSRSATG